MGLGKNLVRAGFLEQRNFSAPSLAVILAVLWANSGLSQDRKNLAQTRFFANSNSH